MPPHSRYYRRCPFAIAAASSRDVDYRSDEEYERLRLVSAEYQFQRGKGQMNLDFCVSNPVLYRHVMSLHVTLHLMSCAGKGTETGRNVTSFHL